MASEKEIRNNRLAKLERIRERDGVVFKDKFKRSHLLAEAGKLKMKSKVRVAGRIMTMRDIGKICFLTLGDDSGQLQLALKMDALGREKYKFFVKNIEPADFIGVSGEIFKTKAGEKTVNVTRYTLLSKAILPLPEKWHGLENEEIKYRKRYLDMLSDPDSKERFVFRSRLISELRNFLENEGFTEIDTPVLVHEAGGAAANPFITHHDAFDQDFFLSIAPDQYLKRIMAANFEGVYNIACCFRNEGLDPSHAQEFRMMELFKAYADYKEMMKFTEKMMQTLVRRLTGGLTTTYGKHTINWKGPWPQYPIADLIKKHAKINIFAHDAASLRREIKKKKLPIKGMSKMGYGTLVDQIYKKTARPKLIQPCFVTDHPIQLKALARISDDNPQVANSFQLLVNGWEITNAYGELIDPIQQKAALDEQAEWRAQGDEEAFPADYGIVTAMEHGLPPMTGVGCGIDRLMCLLTNQPNVKDVIVFPLMRRK